MIEVSKNDLYQILTTIASYDPVTQKPIHGLLYENVSLGLKRRLQKIHIALYKKYDELLNDIKEVEFVKEESDRIKEMEILLNEKIFIDEEKVSLKLIEDIKTDFNYNFELIEKIAQ